MNGEAIAPPSDGLVGALELLGREEKVESDEQLVSTLCAIQQVRL
jgi:hypothetical protein